MKAPKCSKAPLTLRDTLEPGGNALAWAGRAMGLRHNLMAQPIDCAAR
jgi:hypothetical protein